MARYSALMAACCLVSLHNACAAGTITSLPSAPCTSPSPAVLTQHPMPCRDNECASTLNSLYKNATHPERVHVGVCQQLKLADETCLPPSVPWSDEVSLITVPFFQAKGPCYARHLVTTLYK